MTRKMHLGRVRLAGCIAFAGLVAADAHSATLEVRIVDGAGKAVGAYVGIASHEASWSNPDAEAITGEDGAARFELRAGTWRIVAGAPRHRTDFERSVSLGADGAQITIPLASLGGVGGRVRTVTGDPVRGARIGMFWEFLEDHPHGLSPKGKRHLLGNTLVESDADGLFELPIPSDREAVVIIEAEGMSPIAVDHVRSGSSSLADVKLEKGAGLHVRWADGSRFEANDRIAVVPVESRLSSSLPEHRAAAMWRRRSDAATWVSLPPGTFDVLLHRDRHATPIVLQRVTLAAGEQRRIELQPPDPQDRATGKTPRLLLNGGRADEPLSVTRWRSHRQATFDADIARTREGVALSVEADCVAGDRWIVSTGSLIGSATMTDCSSPNAVVPMRRRAELQIRFAVPRTVALPSAASIEGFDCASNAAVAVDFPIHKDISVVPFVAGCTAATIRVPGFLAVATGRLELKAGEHRELPPVRLQPARSVLARVTDAYGLPKAGARVQAVRAGDFANARAIDALVSLPTVAEARSDSKGWARLAELSNEALMLLVFINGEPYPYLAGPHEVLAGEERIDEIVLRGPARVRITLDRDEKSAAVIASGVILTPAEGSPWPRGIELRSPFGADSAAVFEAVPPGSWIVSAHVRADAGTIVPVGHEQIDVLPGASIVQSIPVGDVIYRGLVRRGGEPVDGSLSLRKVDAGAGFPIQSATVRGGRFAVVLERGGEFVASLQTFDFRRIPIATPVVFESTQKEVVITLGDARISGRVENSRGEPVADSRVTAIRQDAGDRRIEAQAISRSDGTFELDALEDGQWTLRAAAPSQQSDAVPVQVAASQSISAVALRLQPLATIRARVRNANGTAAAGAVVVAYVYARPGDGAVLSRTNEIGEVTLELPSIAPDADKAAANVVILANDGSVSSHHLELRDGMAIILPVAYGSVRIRREDGVWDAAAMRDKVLVAEDGSWVHLTNAGRIQIHQDVIDVPRIAAGRWRYVTAALPVVRGGQAASIAPQAVFVADASAPAELTIKKERP